MSSMRKDDEQEILQLMLEYCDSIDRGDLDGCAALFADGAWGIEGDLAHGAAAVRAVLDNVTLYEGIPNTRHLMTNNQIFVDEAQGRARANCCLMVMQCVPGDFPMQAIFIGTYQDTFHKEDGRWVFTERVIQPNLVGDLSRHRSDMA